MLLAEKQPVAKGQITELKTYLMLSKIKLLLLLMLISTTTCLANNETFINHEEEKSEIFFKEKKIDFGTIKKKKQESIIVNFEYENRGSSPLVIIKADVSCNCMLAEYDKKPVMPGGKNILSVTIDTKYQKGDFNKTIMVKCNGKEEFTVLRITGTIK